MRSNRLDCLPGLEYDLEWKDMTQKEWVSWMAYWCGAIPGFLDAVSVSGMVQRKSETLCEAEPCSGK